MKWNDYANCVEFTNRALERIDGFMNDTKAFSSDNRLEAKLLL
jgi:hypothetical protein